MARLRLRVLDANERPQVPGDVLGGAVGVFPDRQDGKGIVYVHGGMGQVVPMGEHKDLCGLFDLELAEDPASQAAFGPDGLRRPHPHQARRRRHVRLPAAPDHGVAVAHQVPVAGLYGRRGLRAPLGAVEGPQDGLAPPVDHVEEESVSASVRVRWLEHREVRRESDPAVGAPRSELDVGDRLVAGVQGVHRKMGLAFDQGVRADASEGLPSGEAAPFGDVETGDGQESTSIFC